MLKKQTTAGGVGVNLTVMVALIVLMMATAVGGGVLSAEQDLDKVTIFITGSELGEMKPCGCSGGQLGGLAKRAAVVGLVDVTQRLLIDTGSLVKDNQIQDLIKFSIINQSLLFLGYDLINLTDKDLNIAANLALLNDDDTVDFISASRKRTELVPQIFVKEFNLATGPMIIVTASYDCESGNVESIEELFDQEKEQCQFNILIVNCFDQRLFEQIQEMKIVNCIICPPQSDDAMLIADDDSMMVIMAVGRYGRSIIKLEVSPKKIEGEFKFQQNFQTIPVTENLADDQSLVQLYEIYQQLVAEADLLQGYPKMAMDSADNRYVGSDSCKGCHLYEYDRWKTKRHAEAYMTLVKDGSEFNPDCVVCHVVGMDYETGYVDNETSPHLKDVGCENCHGPGLTHIKTLGKAKCTNQSPQKACLDCHTPEHSGNYAGNEDQYLKKIVHWREPKAEKDIKDSSK